MPTDVHLAVAFGLGLAASLHCLGMCGAVLSALSLSVAPELRTRTAALLKFTIGYSLGRVGSYALAGALAAGLGTSLAGTGSELAYRGLQSLAWVLVLAMAAQLAGLASPLAPLERLAGRLWLRLVPAARALLPVRHLRQALALGALWGWMPCGLVYATLLWAAGAGDALRGAMAMAAFGAGTLPAVVAGGVLGGRLAGLAGRRALRAAAAAALVLLATLGLWQTWAGSGHAGHAMAPAAGGAAPGLHDPSHVPAQGSEHLHHH